MVSSLKNKENMKRYAVISIILSVLTIHASGKSNFWIIILLFTIKPVLEAARLLFISRASYCGYNSRAASKKGRLIFNLFLVIVLILPQSSLVKWSKYAKPKVMSFTFIENLSTYLFSYS